MTLSNLNFYIVLKIRPLVCTVLFCKGLNLKTIYVVFNLVGYKLHAFHSLFGVKISTEKIFNWSFEIIGLSVFNIKTKT